MKLTDEQCDNIIFELDDYATSIDMYDYGLPTSESNLIELRDRIRKVLEAEPAT